ncbi:MULTISPECIES: arginine repressor ArgR [Wolbachia]|jgi:transcriptional regulator of arginine metabolism|uniref:arginine repressor ArgR n=2 Tax=Wolbachieae TaxID=952 RepID=UPI000023B9F6|nr:MULTISPECIES: arginine repressor ArgR [Wolbachia]MDE5063281.1 ArgR family transcriptional regulator [Wolbachia endosymbiont of Drosophila chauvacae]MDU8940818.1 ArgR family transcriptional regulator [Wolbachia endosymbiont of Drosophila malagassya]MDX5497034.1 ArgR family transcriptional regulator [Wolbachia endosymbiont of Nomada fabriciana]MDX5507903.1 ArgR family transcriptional regulator [Wolbachia endosymbiont of Hylaeus sinuatus]MDX5518987.1 ArgR family transcriptional regulator [Wolb
MHDNTLGEHILNIIQNHEILEQSDLQTLLKERGHNIPQATLSRKLKKLKIAKVAGMYKVIDINQYRLPLILNMQISDFGLIVLHTQPGQASSLAYFLDQKYVIYSLNNSKNIGIIGTIAGDDTVLLIIKSKAELNKVLQSIYETFPYLSPE